MSNEVKSVQLAIDGSTAGTFNIFKAPDDTLGGGLTILEVFLLGAGTATTAIYTATDVGTPVINGTVVASAAGTIAAGVPHEYTVADAWVDGGEWVQFAITAGTIQATGFLLINYVAGRGAS